MRICFYTRESSELCWTRPGERVGRSKRKLSLKRRALTWASTAAAHPPLCFKDSPKRRPLGWARVVSPERVGLAWARPRRASYCSLAQARAGSLSEGFLSPEGSLAWARLGKVKCINVCFTWLVDAHFKHFKSWCYMYSIRYIEAGSWCVWHELGVIYAWLVGYIYTYWHEIYVYENSMSGW